MHFEKCRGCARLVLVFIFWYLSCYFLMMDWRTLAYDPTFNEWTGESCYYMAPMVHVRGNITMIGGSACWANTFFRPLDWLLYRAKAALGVRVFVIDCWTVWAFLFWTNLLLPFLSVVRHGGSPLRHRGMHILLSLFAAGWYIGLWFLYHLIRNCEATRFVAKPMAVIGTLAALAAIYRLARARGYPFVVPLAFATLSGTIWLLVSLPRKWPYV
jgi:hypothetical protein